MKWFRWSKLILISLFQGFFTFIFYSIPLLFKTRISMLHLCEIVSSFEGFFFGTFVIVFVWSQFDAGKIDNRTIGLWFPPKAKRNQAREY